MFFFHFGISISNTRGRKNCLFVCLFVCLCVYSVPRNDKNSHKRQKINKVIQGSNGHYRYSVFLPSSKFVKLWRLVLTLNANININHYVIRLFLPHIHGRKLPLHSYGVYMAIITIFLSSSRDGHNFNR